MAAPTVTYLNIVFVEFHCFGPDCWSLVQVSVIKKIAAMKETQDHGLIKNIFKWD